MDLDRGRNFSAKDVLNESWHLIHGSKWPIWAIAIFIGIASLIIQFIITWVFHMDLQSSPVIYRYLLMPLINNVIIAPFFAGATMTAILRARGHTTNARTGFQYFNKTLPVMAVLFIIAFFANILAYIAHLPSLTMALNLHTGWLNLLATAVAILIYVFCFLSVPLVVDKNQSPWKALTTSCRIIRHCWLNALILLIVVYVCFILAMIPIYVGAMIHPIAKFIGAAIMLAALIWLMPFLFLVQGVLYHKLVD